MVDAEKRAFLQRLQYLDREVSLVVESDNLVGTVLRVASAGVYISEGDDPMTFISFVPFEEIQRITLRLTNEDEFVNVDELVGFDDPDEAGDTGLNDGEG